MRLFWARYLYMIKSEFIELYIYVYVCVCICYYAKISLRKSKFCHNPDSTAQLIILNNYQPNVTYFENLILVFSWGITAIQYYIGFRWIVIQHLFTLKNGYHEKSSYHLSP